MQEKTREIIDNYKLLEKVYDLRFGDVTLIEDIVIYDYKRNLKRSICLKNYRQLRTMISRDAKKNLTKKRDIDIPI
jgi:hypothetical protein